MSGCFMLFFPAIAFEQYQRMRDLDNPAPVPQAARRCRRSRGWQWQYRRPELLQVCELVSAQQVSPSPVAAAGRAPAPPQHR